MPKESNLLLVAPARLAEGPDLSPTCLGKGSASKLSFNILAVGTFLFLLWGTLAQASRSNIQSISQVGTRQNSREGLLLDIFLGLAPIFLLPLFKPISASASQYQEARSCGCRPFGIATCFKTQDTLVWEPLLGFLLGYATALSVTFVGMEMKLFSATLKQLHLT